VLTSLNPNSNKSVMLYPVNIIGRLDSGQSVQRRATLAHNVGTFTVKMQMDDISVKISVNIRQNQITRSHVWKLTVRLNGSQVNGELAQVLVEVVHRHGELYAEVQEDFFFRRNIAKGIQNQVQKDLAQGRYVTEVFGWHRNGVSAPLIVDLVTNIEKCSVLQRRGQLSLKLMNTVVLPARNQVK